MGDQLTHFDKAGNAHMVDVSAKPDSTRKAVATGTITMSETALTRVKEGTITKGDVLGIARIAGIMAAKKVDDLIPLTHPLNITQADIDFTINDAALSIDIKATVSITGKTGVEMEALTAVTVAALTIYDMCKAIDKSMTIGNICLLAKEGGKSGPYRRKQ